MYVQVQYTQSCNQIIRYVAKGLDIQTKYFKFMNCMKVDILGMLFENIFSLNFESLSFCGCA